MSRRDYVGESESMDAILASDRFVEQLRTTGTFEPSSREDAALASLLLEWRDEVREAPITPPPRVEDDAVTSIKQPRRIAQRSVAVAGALLAMSSAAATAFDGDPLRPVRFLVDLGVTVGEGIGNPDNDSSTDGVEPNPQELDGEEPSEGPETAVDSGEHGASGPGTDGPEDAKSPNDPGSPESPDSEGETDGDSVPIEPQPTDEVAEEPPPVDEEPGDGGPDPTDPTDEPEQPPTTDPTDPTDEPEQPPTTDPTDPPPTTTDGEDTDGEENEGEGGGDGELPPEDPNPEQPGAPETGPGPETEPGPEAPGDSESDDAPPADDQPGHDDPVDEGSAESDWGDDGPGHSDWGDDWDHGGPDWMHDWPSFWWNEWLESRHSWRH